MGLAYMVKETFRSEVSSKVDGHRAKLSGHAEAYLLKNTNFVPGSFYLYKEHKAVPGSNGIIEYTLLFRSYTDKWATQDGSLKHRVDLAIPVEDMSELEGQTLEAAVALVLKTQARDVASYDYWLCEQGRADQRSVYSWMPGESSVVDQLITKVDES